MFTVASGWHVGFESEHRERNIHGSSGKEMVISGNSLTLPVLSLTCNSGLLATGKKLSSFLHLSGGSLVSRV